MYGHKYKYDDELTIVTPDPSDKPSHWLKRLWCSLMHGWREKCTGYNWIYCYTCGATHKQTESYRRKVDQFVEDHL